MLRTLANARCGALLMHSRGKPHEWRSQAAAADVVGLVLHELEKLLRDAESAGIKRERIALDPGFGFGKSFDENYPLLARFDQLHRLGRPLVAGTSRKGFIGRTLARDGCDAPVEQRLYGTIATVTASILKGAHIVRVHDVAAAARDAVRVADAILAAELLRVGD
jgi:dihydropteroate synthase